MPTRSLFQDKRLFPISVISAYFLFILLFVSLKGNFPLNDDWAYGEGVRAILQTGQLTMPRVCAAGFTHVLLGTLFCKVFGFSYVILRTVVFSLGFIGCFALYGAIRELGITRKTATFYSLIYACNPLTVNLCFSFMSDITALSLINIYFYLLLRSLKRNDLKLAWLSILVFSLAICTRQSVIIFLLCNLSFIFLQTTKHQRFLLLITSLLLPYLLYTGIDHWLMSTNHAGQSYVMLKEQHHRFINELFSSPIQWLYKFSWGLGQTACYLGLFCSPILLALFLQSKQILSKHIKHLWYWLLMAAIIVAISIFELIIVQSKLMPFNQNLLRLPFVCALTIMGLSMPLFSKKILKWVTVISFSLAYILLAGLGASIQLLISIAKRSIKPNAYSRKYFALAFICIISMLASTMFSVIETIVWCTDRYYLIALAPWLLTLAFITKQQSLKIVRPLSISALILIAAFSACAAQDYLGWNRARWIGLERLEARGIPSEQIDGGYEYNSMRDNKIYDSTNHGAPPRDHWRWWPIKGEDYILSFSPIPNYTVTDHVPYWSALAFSQKEVLILRSENKKESK